MQSKNFKNNHLLSGGKSVNSIGGIHAAAKQFNHRVASNAGSNKNFTEKGINTMANGS